MPALSLFFVNDTATTEIYTLSLHDALPIFSGVAGRRLRDRDLSDSRRWIDRLNPRPEAPGSAGCAGKGIKRSEEHTSELQSLAYLVCRLLLEKKKKQAT